MLTTPMALLWGVGFLKGRPYAFSRCLPPYPNTVQLEWDDPSGLDLKQSRGFVSTETNDSNSLRLSVDGCSRFPERSGRTMYGRRLGRTRDGAGIPFSSDGSHVTT